MSGGESVTAGSVGHSNQRNNPAPAMAAVEEVDFQSLEKEYNEMFAYRYTDEDEEYKKIVSQPPANPPCVEHYFNKPRRNFDGNRGGWRDRRGDNRGRGGWHGNQRDSYQRDRYSGHHQDQGYQRSNRDWQGGNRHGGQRYQPY